uniref:Uncharacterized protein n=1 Tax=Anguilla anguilla TaxID=7936 RepID=A0A0E9TC83_ANGAN
MLDEVFSSLLSHSGYSSPLCYSSKLGTISLILGISFPSVLNVMTCLGWSFPKEAPIKVFSSS